MDKKVVFIHNNICKETGQEVVLEELFAEQSQNLYWVNYEISTDDEWGELLAALPLSEFEQRFFIDKKAFPRVEVVQSAGLYLRIPTSNRWEETTYFIHLVLLGNIVLTITKNESETLDKAYQQLQAGVKLEGEEGIFLLMYLLEGMEEHLINNYLEARSIINSFIKSLESIPDDQDNDNVVKIKGRLMNITGQCEDFLFACTLLRTVISVSFFPAHTKKLLNDILDTLAHVEQSMHKLDKHLEDQLHRIDSHFRELSDKRLRILTVLSSIFLPLTFISSLYGMNFEHMPEYGYEYAYPICLGIMLFIGLGMIVYYAVKGWFH